MSALLILWFSGTGNSAYIAQELARKTGDRLVSLNRLIKEGDKLELPNERLIFVTPTYGWRIPRLVSQFIEEMAFHGDQRAYFLMTCGDDIGNASHYLKKLCREKKLQYMGCRALIMPENYTALFPIPSVKKSKALIAKAEVEVENLAEQIKSGQRLSQSKVNLLDRLKSGLINKLFYTFIISARKFKYTNRCIGCGDCARHCPTNNIKMIDDRPRWGDDCTHCMACINRCPVEAIEYGKKTVGKRRYVCPNVEIEL